MTTHPWFPIPVYINKAEGEEFDNIQKELGDICDNLDFTQNPNWTSDTHDLSLGKSGSFFDDDILSENGADKFLKFIDKNVITYLNEIGCTEKRSYVIANSWFTKTKKGKYAHLHDHGWYDISGVYYLNTNGKDGHLMFPNPQKQYACNFIFSQISRSYAGLPLENGIIALWPSILQHNTETNKTDNERISISFNIKFGL
tara:strand:+ start:490 stop:1089 length:600 start_codon:yes stop_codon:yes gene_type:complete